MTITALPFHDSDGDWHVPGDAPVAPAGRLPDGPDPGCLSRFGDDIWDLSPFSLREHEPGRRINWASFPAVLRSGFKRAGWALITLPTPEALLERAATSRVEHPSTGTIAAVTEQWRRYAAWLASRGITGLAEVDAAPRRKLIRRARRAFDQAEARNAGNPGFEPYPAGAPRHLALIAEAVLAERAAMREAVASTMAVPGTNPESPEVTRIIERVRAGESPEAIARETGALQ